MSLSDLEVMRWFNENLGDYINMYTSGGADQSVILCETFPCVVITTSRIIRKRAKDGSEDLNDLLMPCSAWTSQLIHWRDESAKRNYVENKCSMFKFSNLQDVVQYVHLLWLLRNETPCLSFKERADNARLRLVTDVNDLKSKSDTALGSLIRPYFCISD